MFKKIFSLYFYDHTPAKGWRKSPPAWLVWNASARRLVFMIGVIATVFASPGIGSEPKLIKFEDDIYLREDLVDHMVAVTGESHEVEGFGYNGGLDTLFGSRPKKIAMNGLLKNARGVCPIGFKIKALKLADIHRGKYSGRYINGAESFGDMGGAQLAHAGYKAVVHCLSVVSR